MPRILLQENQLTKVLQECSGHVLSYCTVHTHQISSTTDSLTPTHSSLKITNRSFRYAAPSLWNKLPLISVSLVRHSLLHFLLSHMAFHHLHLLHYHRLHHLLFAQNFILNSRLGSSANPFLHRPFPFLPE